METAEQEPDVASVRVVAEGPGWCVSDIVCRAGPEHSPFEEAHEWVSISAVVSGSFVYRSTHGRRLMTPGSFLLGDQHACFECSHEHGTGDRCIAFHYDPTLIEEAAGELRDIRSTAFSEHRLPPCDKLLPYMHGASRLALHPSEQGIEATVFELASAILAVVNDTGEARLTFKDEARVAASVERINRAYDQPLTLELLAAEAGVSKFHFTRIFRRMAGVTPYAYVLNRRLLAAADLLSTSDRPVLDIALSCGFGDLSEFTRRFRRHFGIPPRAFRARASLSQPY